MRGQSGIWSGLYLCSGRLCAGQLLRDVPGTHPEVKQSPYSNRNLEKLGCKMYFQKCLDKRMRSEFLFPGMDIHVSEGD